MLQCTASKTTSVIKILIFFKQTYIIAILKRTTYTKDNIIKENIPKKVQTKKEEKLTIKILHNGNSNPVRQNSAHKHYFSLLPYQINAECLDNVRPIKGKQLVIPPTALCKLYNNTP